MYEVKATFFILGMHAEFYPELVLREKKEGHEIGVHSFNHININEEKVEVVEAEFDRTQNIIEKITREKSKLFRPPYGIQNGDIVLFHHHNEAEVNQTIEALKIILPELIEKGYRFVTISKLLGNEV